ncbi:hypothetical protein LXA43DRAFT_1100710 [Ganoderma leucocontextum]|nr:hypothetical protein LXA43DRAFT_1100710 [Ganoderma leucocontextum]
MVRKEYLQLWDFVKDAHDGKHSEGLVVTGQPGTGKTRFLQYAFARALKEHIPVAFCNSPAEYYFCDGVQALADSNESLESPPHIFLDRSQLCYTIQATSPQPVRWRGWAKERESAEYWVLSCWARDEVRKFQHFYEQKGLCPWKDNDADYYSPLEIFDHLGPSARKCFARRGSKRTAQGPERDFCKYLQPDDILKNVDDFIAALKTGVVTSPRQGLNFRRLFFAFKPDDASNPMDHEPDFHYAIPTSFISGLLSDYFSRRTVEEQVSLLSKFAPYPQLMGLVFEPLVLQFLTSSEKPIPCHLVDGSTIMLGPHLWLVNRQLDADVSIEPRNNDIHVPRTGFPSLDGLIILINEDQTQVLLLQMTVASTHKVVAKGVAAIVKLIGASTKTSFKFIFVTPGPSGEKMAKKLQEIKIRGRPSIFVEAGWIETGELLSCPQEVLDTLIRFDADKLEVDEDDTYEETPAKRARTT